MYSTVVALPGMSDVYSKYIKDSGWSRTLEFFEAFHPLDSSETIPHLYRDGHKLTKFNILSFWKSVVFYFLKKFVYLILTNNTFLHHRLNQPFYRSFYKGEISVTGIIKRVASYREKMLFSESLGIYECLAKENYFVIPVLASSAIRKYP